MELKRFKNAWHTQPVDGAFARKEREMIDDVKTNMRKFHRKILLRDISETAAALLVSVVFVAASFWGGWVMRAGALAVVAACVYVVVVLHRSRQRPPSPDAAMKQQLTRELSAVERQIQLLRSVLSWYIAPLFLGAAIWGVGFALAIPIDAGVPRAVMVVGMAVSTFGIMAVVGWLVWWMNQHAVKHQLEPLRQRITDALNALGNGQQT